MHCVNSKTKNLQQLAKAYHPTNWKSYIKEVTEIDTIKRSTLLYTLIDRYMSISETYNNKSAEDDVTAEITEMLLIDSFVAGMMFANGEIDKHEYLRLFEDHQSQLEIIVTPEEFVRGIPLKMQPERLNWSKTNMLNSLLHLKNCVDDKRSQ